jgi:hypothetical protein
MEVGSIHAQMSPSFVAASPKSAAPIAPHVCDAVYARNMSVLWRKDAALAHRIDQVSDSDRPVLVTARSGHPTTRVDTPTGQTFLHSKYDPVSEAKKLIDATLLDDKFCFVVFGFGLGYHIVELFDRLKGDAVIVVIEPSLPILSAAMSAVDLTTQLASDRLVLLDRLDKSDIHERLRPHATMMMLGAQFVAHPASGQVAADFHTQARKTIIDYIAYARMTLLTLVGNSQITCRNIAHNLPKYLSTPPINTLRNRFKGRPGIVISGGPSLRKNIDLLTEAKGNAVLCAVQSLFKPLLRRGIVPDFVTSLDFHEMSKQFFNGVEDFKGVHLIAEPKVSWHVLDQYDGPVSLLYSDFAEKLLGRELAARDGLKPGATVAHLAFYLAAYMGCDPIIFVGQDLAFTDHCFYMPGVETHQTWRSEFSRFNTLETKEWERIVRNRPILRKTTDVNGRNVYTDDLLFTYLEQFERDFAETSATIIDATEGGARMRGTQVMTLRQALDTYAASPLPADAFDYRKRCNWNDNALLASGRDELTHRIEEIEHLVEVCDEMLGILKELTELTSDAAAFNRRLHRVDELRAVVARASRSYDIINAATQKAELQRFSADRRLDATDTSGADRAKRQLARDTNFVRSFREGADQMLGILEATLARFDDHTGNSPS